MRTRQRDAGVVLWTSVLAVAVALAARPGAAITNLGYRGLTYPERRTLVLPALGGPQVNSLNGNLVLRRELLDVEGKGLPVELTVVYNSDRRLISSPFGMGWSFSYGIRYVRNAAGDVSVVWGDGRVDVFTKNGGGYSAPAGVHLALTEPSPGDLRLRTTLGIELRFADAGHRKLTSITDPNGNAVSLAYGPGSRLSTITDASGRSWSFAYDAQGRVMTVSGGSGVITTLTYDSASRLVGLAAGASGAEAMAYNTDNLLTTFTDRRGNAVTIGYVTPGGSPGTRLPQTLAKGGSAVTFAFDAGSRTTTLQDPNGNFWTYVYDGAGNLVTLGDPILKTASLAWSPQHDLTGFTDRNGHTRTFTYDARGNLTSVTTPFDGSTSATTTIAYEPAFNRPTAITDAKGNTSSLEYDARGNLVKLSDPAPLGTFTSYTVDSSGQQVASTDRNGQITTVGYDGFGNVTSIAGPLGHTTAFEYSGSGRLSRVTDANGNVTEYSFDAATRTRHVTDARGNADSSTADANGNLVEYTDREGNTTHYAYDALDRLVAITDALGHADSRSYDDAGNLTSYVDRRGKTWAQTFDFRGQLASRSDPVGGTWQYSYDSDGNLKTVTDAKGQVTTLAYDFAGRLIQRDFADGRRAVFTYDGNGELLTAKDGLVAPPTPFSDFTYTYDELGREHSVRDNLMGKTVQYGYDGVGRLAQKSLVGGAAATYAYDAAGRMVSLTAFGGTSTFGYDNEGNRTSELRSNGMTVADTYDANGELATETIHAAPAFGSGVVASFAYTRDKNGQVVQTVRNTGETISYAWDALGRAVQESGNVSGAYSLQRGYDANGNWTSYSGSFGGASIAQTIAFDDANRPTTRTTAIGGTATTYTYAYDANGNRTSMSFAPATVHSYTYDASNRLVGLVPGAGTPVTYAYNVFDQFSRRTSGGDTLKALYGSPEVLAWTDAANIVLATYFTAAVVALRGENDPLSRTLITNLVRALGYLMFNPRATMARGMGGFGMGGGRTPLRLGSYLEGDRIVPANDCFRPSISPLQALAAVSLVAYVSQTVFGVESWFRATNLPSGYYDPCWRPVGLVANGIGNVFFMKDYFVDGSVRSQSGGMPAYHEIFANGKAGLEVDGYDFRGPWVKDAATLVPLNGTRGWANPRGMEAGRGEGLGGSSDAMRFRNF